MDIFVKSERNHHFFKSCLPACTGNYTLVLKFLDIKTC